MNKQDRLLPDPITAWEHYTEREEQDYLNDWVEYDKFINFIKQPLMACKIDQDDCKI